ncbi:MAG: CDP-alcohol phosphatidyltransferase family protein, partial [Chloroflexota bacterium]
MTHSAERLNSIDPSIARLRRTWRWLAVLTALLLLAGFARLRVAWGLSSATRWLLIASLAAGYQLWFLRRNLGRNRSSTEQRLLPDLGVGTITTFARGLLLAAVGGFLFSARPPGVLAWAPTVLFTTAELLDYLDGYLARRSRHLTQLGEALDLELDSLGMFAGSLLAVWYRALPWPFLLIGLASYLFQLGKWALRRTGRPVRELPRSVSRRPIAGLMMGFLGAMLWPIVKPPGTTLAGLFFIGPFLASFARDWLVVSGAVDPSAPVYQRTRSWVRAALLRWAPLAARTVVVLSLAVEISRRTARLAIESELFLQAGFPFNQGVVRIFLVLEVLGAILIGLGIAGRIAALALVFPVGFTILAEGLSKPVAIL